jgi:hypothetical protein
MQRVLCLHPPLSFREDLYRPLWADSPIHYVGLLADAPSLLLPWSKSKVNPSTDKGEKTCLLRPLLA